MEYECFFAYANTERVLKNSFFLSHRQQKIVYINIRIKLCFEVPQSVLPDTMVSGAFPYKKMCTLEKRNYEPVHKRRVIGYDPKSHSRG